MNTVKRSEIIQYLAKHGNLTYVQAEHAYAAFMRLLEDAISRRSKLNLARIGCIEPIELPPRRVVMGFKRRGKTVTKCRRDYWLGARTRYVFKLHKAFGQDHNLSP